MGAGRSASRSTEPSLRSFATPCPCIRLRVQSNAILHASAIPTSRDMGIWSHCRPQNHHLWVGHAGECMPQAEVLTMRHRISPITVIVPSGRKHYVCIQTTHLADGPSKPFCHSTNQTGNNEAHIPLTAVTTIATITAITAVTAITVKHRPKAPPFADSHGQRLPAASAPHASNHLPHPTGTAQLVTRAGRRNRCGSSCLLQPRAATHAPEASPPAGAAFER